MNLYVNDPVFQCLLVGQNITQFTAAGFGALKKKNMKRQKVVSGLLHAFGSSHDHLLSGFGERSSFSR